VYQNGILVFLELKLIGLCVHDDDRGDGAAISEAASALHNFIDNVHGHNGLFRQLIHMLFLKFVQENVIEDNQDFTVVFAGFQSCVGRQYVVSVG